MATFPSNLGALVCADEASFGEDSTTYDERLPVINSTTEMAAALEQSKVPVPVTQQYQNDGRHEARGVYGGSFPVSLYLSGHGSTCAGAISATDLGTALGRWLGVHNTAMEGEEVTTGASATSFDTKDTSPELAAGGIIRIGALSDDKGNGQAYAISSTGGTTTLLNACEGTPATDDVIYAGEIVHPAEDATGATITTERYGILTANQAYDCHGCWCSAIDFTGFNPGEIPQITGNISTSRWGAKASESWPTATAVDSFTPAPVSAGSFFINVVGTSTLATETIRDVQFSVDLQTVPLLGPGADDARQVVVGVRRVRCQGSLTFTVDSEAQATDTWGDRWNASSPDYYHWMLTLSAEDGSSVAIYSPKSKIVGVRPTQHDLNGVNAKTVTLQCLSGGTTTTDLTQSNFRIYLG
jgi:hypothetical protein